MNPSDVVSSSAERPREVPSTFLIVNDDSDVLFLYVHAVTRGFPGAKVVTARDGKEAWDLIQSQTISAVVTDNRMPVLSGLALTRMIRDAGLDLPVVMVTGATELCDAAMEAGVTVFDSDGIPETVVGALKRVLSSV